MDAVEAYKASWNATKGHGSKIWGLIGVTALFALLMIVVIGVYFIIMYAAAFALFYLYITTSSSTRSTSRHAS
jgi:hypothetical protein